ncbi:MAG: hypothetical protein II543_07030, partial [Desulfovibrio sp.]|nr:hypothetical protein [Desulfovibrio sp.]
AGDPRRRVHRRQPCVARRRRRCRAATSSARTTGEIAVQASISRPASAGAEAPPTVAPATSARMGVWKKTGLLAC